MVEWLLGDKQNQTYREQQLSAAASGNFFKTFVFEIQSNTSISIEFILEVDRVITVNFLLLLLAVRINGA